MEAHKINYTITFIPSVISLEGRLAAGIFPSGDFVSLGVLSIRGADQRVMSTCVQPLTCSF